MVEGKGREERSVGLDGSEMAEAKATKPEGQGDLAAMGPAALQGRSIRVNTAARSWASTRARGAERMFHERNASCGLGGRIVG
jgi:hypothetical protein